eukprot:CAMPEP_0194347746 /NCGR_PEP_ID=MMETSP0171-20130528/106163_1 /TAXON_ID=218684 /ORGANISM="Corethron pennatum, Strain L29A3" /LENGTH=620 /DNA_ID=CAMNT_0039115033 /DNA_START=138 /DNA_END=2000 /DNA_ORIENTATION=+
MWGNVTPYITSYLAQFNPVITYHDTLHVYTILLLGQSFAMFPGGVLEEMIGPSRTVLLATLLISGGTYASSYCTALEKLVACQGVVGLGIGIGYSAPIICCFKHYQSDRMGLVTGMITTGTGMGPFIFSLIAVHYVNPNNLPVDPVTMFYDFPGSPVADRVPGMYRMLSMLFFVCGLVGSLLIGNPKNPEPVSSPTDSVERGESHPLLKSPSITRPPGFDITSKKRKPRHKLTLSSLGTLKENERISKSQLDLEKASENTPESRGNKLDKWNRSPSKTSRHVPTYSDLKLIKMPSFNDWITNASGKIGISPSGDETENLRITRSQLDAEKASENIPESGGNRLDRWNRSPSKTSRHVPTYSDLMLMRMPSFNDWITNTSGKMGTPLSGDGTAPPAGHRRYDSIAVKIVKTQELTTREMMGEPLCWLVVLCKIFTLSVGFYVCATFKSFGQYTIPDDHYLTMVGCVACCCSGLSRTVWAYIADTFGTFQTLVVVSYASPITLLIYTLTSENKYAFGASVCLEFMYLGAYYTLFPGIIAFLFGETNMGTNYGFIFFVFGISSTALVDSAGYINLPFKDINLIFTIFGIIGALACSHLQYLTTEVKDEKVMKHHRSVSSMIGL